jgi:ABC-type ATPase with predicted acetyltransferase domain
VVDEFTSVVDRQVAQIGSHAVPKLVRREERKPMVATCHYDVLDSLQPGG